MAYGSRSAECLESTAKQRAAASKPCRGSALAPPILPAADTFKQRATRPPPPGRRCQGQDLPWTNSAEKWKTRHPKPQRATVRDCWQRLLQVTLRNKLRPPQQRGAESGVPALSLHEADRKRLVVIAEAWALNASMDTTSPGNGDHGLLRRPLRYRPLEDLALFRRSKKNRLGQM